MTQTQQVSEKARELVGDLLNTAANWQANANMATIVENATAYHALAAYIAELESGITDAGISLSVYHEAQDIIRSLEADVVEAERWCNNCGSRDIARASRTPTDHAPCKQCGDRDHTTDQHRFHSFAAPTEKENEDG